MAQVMHLLCGDIGGTKTIVQHVGVDDTCFNHSEKRYASNAFPDFETLLADFLDTLDEETRASISAACFGVAGPVMATDTAQTSRITNLPWVLDSARIANRFQLPRVALINDFEAIGYGIEALESSDLVSIQAGVVSENGNQLVIGAGTGLGVAQRVWSADRYKVFATEGGHCEFAPADTQQLKLAEFLLHQLGRNSIEFALSGPGLINIYRFLCQQEGQTESVEYQSIMQADDPAAAIAALADENSASLPCLALKLFVRVYGGQAGNFALSSLAPKILPHLQEGEFIQAFNAKGKMAELMQRVPVKVITNPDVGLLGSRVYAEILANI
jgi:glucokinase